MFNLLLLLLFEIRSNWFIYLKSFAANKFFEEEKPFVQMNSSFGTFKPLQTSRVISRQIQQYIIVRVLLSREANLKRTQQQQQQK